MTTKEKKLLFEFAIWFLNYLDIEYPSKKAVKEKINEFENERQTN